jgi:hypothetical protein
VSITTKKEEAKVTNEKYKKGDFLFYITRDKKVSFAEVLKVNEEIDAYDILDQSQYTYRVVHHDSCFDSEKAAKAYLKFSKKGKT